MREISWGREMSEQENNGANLPKTWSDTLQSIAEGGLPQIIAGPAGKAISRLIGATVEIPAAWFEQKAQGIRDETEARSKMMQTLAEKSTELGLSDPKLLERGLNSMLGRAYREQENREAVAGKVLEQLRLDPPPEDSAGPSDDWLNLFEDFASKASSEWVRENWARVLAGEIRKPSSFSLQTMSFLAQLDQPSALAVERALMKVMNGSIAMIGNVSGDEYETLNLARSLGIVHQFDTDTVVTNIFNEHGRIVYRQNNVAVVVNGPAGGEIKINGSAISRVARELHPVLMPTFSEDAISSLIEQLKSFDQVISIDRGDFETRDGRSFAANLTTVWERDSPNNASS
jgi:hypothetical protein